MRNPIKKTLGFLLAASCSLAFLNLGLASGAVEPTTVTEMLGVLRVSPESSKQTYNRALFKHWVDADRNGCDTRAEVLISESRKKVTRQGKCTIVSGDWLSIYDNSVIKVGSKLDVDHLVPLAEAWRSGASDWTPASRQAFANDLSVSYALVAVSASSNRSKGDRDPANWLPKYSANVCKYIGSWIAVKYRWDLTIDEAEVLALSKKIVSCGSKAEVPVPARMLSVSAPTIAPSPVASPVPTPVVSKPVPKSEVAFIDVSGPRDAVAGSTIELSITATDLNGRPVEGKVITYSDTTNVLVGETAPTNSQGKTTLNLSLNSQLQYVAGLTFRSDRLGFGQYVVFLSAPQVTPAPVATPSSSPSPSTTPTAKPTDPRFSTCAAAKSAGYGPYFRGVNPEYDWYRDADKDGIVCEG